MKKATTLLFPIKKTWLRVWRIEGEDFSNKKDFKLKNPIRLWSECVIILLVFLTWNVTNQ